jgi:hypothetical protein
MSKGLDIGSMLFNAAMIITIVGVLALALLFIKAFTDDVRSNPQNCNNNSFECRNIQVQECVKSEQYTRDECIKLVGSNGH